MRREPPMQLVEKLLRQILSAVIESVDVTFVQAKHGAHVMLRELGTFIGPNRNAALRHLAPLPFDFIAPVAAKTAEVIIEGTEVAVLPMKLNAGARKKSYLLQRLALVGEAESYMDG